MIAIPTTFETELNSNRIEEQGAGMLLKHKNVSPKTLRKCADKVLSDLSYRQNSKRIGDACRNAGGAKRTADILLNYVTGAR